MDKVGVLAVQGDFEKHAEALRRCGVPDSHIQYVRQNTELAEIGRLIIPGGESSTVGLLLERYGLGDSIISRASVGMPVWGTCMGMIMMAKHVEGREQYTLDLLDITVRRNAFGRQVHSFEAAVQVIGVKEPVTGVFIRAPIVTQVGEGIEVLSQIDGQIIAVKAGKMLGTSFHPELTDDVRLHEFFLTM